MSLDITKFLGKVSYNGTDYTRPEKPMGKYKVEVVDYDGTPIAEKFLDAGETYTLPDAPTHNRLTFQEWTATEPVVDNTIVVDNQDVLVAPIYETTSGLTEFDLTINENTGFNFTLNMDGTKDWGDGTSDDLTTHTYAQRGEYVVTCNGTTMTTSSAGLFGQSGYGAENYSVKKVRLSTQITRIEYQAFQNCNTLSAVSVTNSLTSLGNDIFEDCFCIGFIAFPLGFEGFSNGMCAKANIRVLIPYGLTHLSGRPFYTNNYSGKVILPNSITSIGMSSLENGKFSSFTMPKNIGAFDSTISYNTNIRKIIIPDNVQMLPAYFIWSCKFLEVVKIPRDLRFVQAGCLDCNECYALSIIDFTSSTSVIPLEGSNSIVPKNTGLKIVVPDALYDAYKTADFWVDLASYIYRESEVEKTW